MRSAPATPDSLPARSAQPSRERRAAWNSRQFCPDTRAAAGGYPHRPGCSVTAAGVVEHGLQRRGPVPVGGAHGVGALAPRCPDPSVRDVFLGLPGDLPAARGSGRIDRRPGGARILSLCFMLGTTGLLYATATRLFNRKTAWFACGLFATVGPTADLGAFATYDAMAIFLLALSSWMAVRAQGRFSELWLGLSALVMILADATKYASALWNPVIIALAVLATDLAPKDAVARGIRYISYALCVAVPTLLLAGGRTYIRGIMSTTLARAADQLLAADGLVDWRDVYRHHRGPRGNRGAGSNWQTSLNHRLLGVVLTVAPVLAPLEETRIHTIASLYKHVVFGGLFGTIIAGYALARATEVNKAKGWRAGAAAVVFCGLVGFGRPATCSGTGQARPDNPYRQSGRVRHAGNRRLDRRVECNPLLSIQKRISRRQG